MTTIKSPASSLTRFSPASLSELVTISVPLMIASLSGLLMSFCDRIILAQFSTDAMNAAVTGGMAANIFSFGALGIAVIAEVFVGKRNGAGKTDTVSEPAWQMIWFSLMTALIFVPGALFFSPLIVPAEQFHGQAVLYFKIWMLFGPFFPMAGALSAFFIGIGRVKIVTVATIGSNLLNAALDYLLVFGIDDIISPMGVMGAALSTGISQAAQVALLAAVFFSKKNRDRYKTSNWRFNWSLFKECLKVASPSALGHMIEISAWALILRLMALEGTTYITSLAIGQNLIILFAFLSQGIQKGILAVAANLIGAQADYLIIKLLRSGLTLLLIIAAILFVPLVIYPDPMISLFLLDENLNYHELFNFAKTTGLFVWLHIFLDSSVWMMAGVLTAYSDTKFIMIANTLSAWLFAVIPTYIFICIFKLPPHYCWMSMNAYAFLNACVFFARTFFILKRKPELVFGE